ncbi:3-keto-5-aminohexanoate cleavage protein [Halobaculum lipolyticum]|uniref:3-keto-5-aminohexanoate cleavage protein n=1 Tax=Halobaculum lipolyticum TaxID=3032001 RepID=A0ABD5W8C1_9EURY|nr:3-keto-5-aminohexanoate cleavage protein [Halobaculum sp. DT31]
MTYQEYLDGKPVVVTAALTGGIQGKEAHPDLPETPEEIAEAAAAVEAAGAAVVHLHARRDNGERAFSTERFQAVTDAVRDATDDVIVQHSTGGTAAPDALRAEPLRTDPAPEMASLDMGPMNRGRRLTSENTRDTVDGLHAEMRERGIKPELEVFNNGHLNESFRILDELADPPYLNLIFGPGTLAPPSPANLQRMVDQLPEGTEFNVIGFGPHQLPLTTQSLLLGGHVRVGLEDNSYLRKGELATNEALVERTVRIAEELGRPVASPAAAREMLGVESRR